MKVFGFGIIVLPGLPVLHALGTVESGLSTARDSTSLAAGAVVPSVTGTLRPPPCKPTFVLDGVSEDRFNKPDTPFAIRPSCNSLDTKLHAVFLAPGCDDQFFGLGRALDDTHIAPDGITVTGLGTGFKPITVIAKDDHSNSLFANFALLFGSFTTPVTVVDEDGEPVLGASVTAEAFAGIEQCAVTDSFGVAILTNLLAIFARLRAGVADERAASVTTVLTPGSATLKLRPSCHPVRRRGIVPRGPYPGVGLASQPRDDHTRCEASPGSAICQPTCRSPPPKSCDFYTRCAEETLQCGPDGYPLQYGAKNCRRFVARLDSFTPEGQAWIWKTMLCLQRYLVGPVAAADATCESVKNEAFQSHPRCYVDSGFCELPFRDFVQVIWTVKSDLFHGPAIEQALKAVRGCAQRFTSEVKSKVVELRSPAKGANTAARSAAIAIYEDLEAYLEKLSSADLV